MFLRAPLSDQPHGGSGSFIGLGSDGETYRIKPLNNFQWPEILVSELLVSRLGQAIGAPVCRVEPMWIGPDHVGWTFRAPRTLEEGFAAASLEVPDATELRALTYRSDDDNRRRHVYVYALRDWCLGDDDQWLYQGTQQNALWSHDHGFYLNKGHIGALDFNLDHNVSFQPPGDASDLDPAAKQEVAGRLRALDERNLGSIMSSVPSSWPVSDGDLQKLGDYLLGRASFVADRLELLA